MGVRATLVVASATAIATVGCTFGGSSGTGQSSPASRPAAAAGTASPSPPDRLRRGVLASISLDAGSAPAPILSAYGSVWVGSHRGDTLYRIDPRRDAIAARIDLNQNTCAPLVAGAGRIWTNYCDDGTVELAVDPKTNQVVGALHTAWIYGFAGGSGWGGLADGTTVRFDPRTLRIVQKLPVRGINGVVAGRYLWLAGGDPDTSHYNGVVTKVDLRTGRVVHRIKTPSFETNPFFTLSPGFIWLKGALDSFFCRIDIVTGAVSKVMIPRLRGLSGYEDVIAVYARGSLWLHTSSGVVERLDRRTGRLESTYPADPNGAGGYVAVGAGSLWVANFNVDTVWRDKM